MSQIIRASLASYYLELRVYKVGPLTMCPPPPKKNTDHSSIRESVIEVVIRVRRMD